MREVPSQDWARLSPLLDELLELGAGARRERLDALRARDPHLADELDALLAQESVVEREHFLEGSALGGADPSLAGRTLGAYTLERPLGAGGMGSVWLARRSDGRFDAAVAVKLLNLALVGRGGAQRFAREGQALARLAHPNIARLLDAGVADGQPYLVLEHVEGEPIDRWCEAHAPGVEKRVRLMLDVLTAVAHAHRNLVLHRDLKPSNILVTAEGRVKLLDFGIAKLLDATDPAAPPSELTQLAGRAFTPDFAAPEQVQGGDVTTATDVYALGVLLYLLLAGVHPTAKAADTPVARLRSVVDTEPQRLSLVTAHGARFAGALRGDLDNICAKALKKSPAERYAGADALADDLKRYLAHQPVAARADSLAYRSAKFVRRHRLAVSAATVTVLALAAGVVGTTWQAIEAGRQRADALAQRDRAQMLLGRNEAIVDFVEMMFGEAVPAGQSEAVRRMLERSEPIVDSAFAAQPAQRADILRVLASYYGNLQLPDKRHGVLQRAREVAQQVPDRSLQAQLACEDANVLSSLGKDDEARRLLDTWIGTPGIDPTVAATCLSVRSALAQTASDPQGALSDAEAALRTLRDAGASAPLLEAGLLGDIAFAHHLAGRNVEADRTFAVAIARLRAMGRGEHRETSRMMLKHGVVRYAMSDFKGGLELFQQVLDVYDRRGDALIAPGIIGNQAFGLEALGRFDDALAAYGRTLDAAKRNGFVAGQAYALVGRATVQAELGQWPAAQASLDEAAPMLEPLPTVHAARVRAAFVQARIDAARGDAARGIERIDAVIEQLAARGTTTPPLMHAHRLRAELALQRRDPARALADAEQALTLARRLQGDHSRSSLTGLARLTLGRALQHGGDHAGARAAWSAAQAELGHTLGTDHPDTVAAARLLAE